MKIISPLAAVCLITFLGVASAQIANAQSTSEGSSCINLTGKYQRHDGNTLTERVITQSGCDTIKITKRTVMPIWLQSKMSYVDSEFAVTDIDLTPDRGYSTIDFEFAPASFAYKSKQFSGTSDMKLIPVYQTTEYSLNAQGDLVETWRVQDRRPGDNFGKDLQKPSVLFPLKRVQ